MDNRLLLDTPRDKRKQSESPFSEAIDRAVLPGTINNTSLRDAKQC